MRQALRRQKGDSRQSTRRGGQTVRNQREQATRREGQTEEATRREGQTVHQGQTVSETTSIVILVMLPPPRSVRRWVRCSAEGAAEAAAKRRQRGTAFPCRIQKNKRLEKRRLAHRPRETSAPTRVGTGFLDQRSWTRHD